MTPGQKIVELREKMNLNQTELSQKLEINRSVLNRIEQGTRPMRDDEIMKIAAYFGVSTDYLLGREIDNNTSPLYGNKTSLYSPSKGRRIPLLGSIPGGIPIEAITEYDGYEEIPANWPGEYLALRVTGRSMEPKYIEGDIVIIRICPDVESGRTAAVLVENEAATLKRVVKNEKGITLVAYNPDVYEPHFYSNEEVQLLPVRIIGDVVQIRRDV